MIAKGQKISDRYQIIKSIGEGGMANVYLARDTILERDVAVKVLRGDLSSDEKFVRRFQREALQASSLNNENIVEVFDVGEDNGEYYIVMEYIEGKHLKNLLKKRGKLTVTEAVDILLQVTSGLSVAHDSYIIHRDIKPQNIMILENGLVKLTDFGIAVAMNSTQLTQTNSVMGSVHYLPPEQASGKGATLQSDIYSLGILFYELLTGKLPFKGDNAVEIALKQLKEPMPSITALLPEIPSSIDNIIRRATAKNPKNRYNDAREMHEDLKTCLSSSRKNEEKIVYQYPDSDIDDVKPAKTKKVKEANDVSKKDSEKVIAKKITEKDLKNQNKTLIVLGSVFTGLVVIITTVILLLPVITKSEQIKVPDVAGLSESDAIEKLQDKGFEIKTTIEETSTKVEEGDVIRTKPSASTKLKKGSEITLYVSTGNKSIKVEDYVGMNYYEVKGKLEAFGITVFIEEEEIEAEVGDELEENTIMRQSVEKDEYLSSGDKITLYIPIIKNLYPDFTDGTYTVSSLIDFCDEYNITVTFIDSSGNQLSIDSSNASEYDDYAILTQSRNAGSKIADNKANITIKLDVDGTGESTSDECENGLC